MQNDGSLYAGQEAKVVLETDKGALELSEEQYNELLTQSQEERIAKYKELAEYNKNVNTRQVRRARARNGR